MPRPIRTAGSWLLRWASLAVVGITEDMSAVPDGTEVVLDAKRGVVFERPAALLHAEG